MSKSKEFLGSQGKILDVFEYFITKNDYITIDEISNLFNLSKSGTYRIFKILQKKGLIKYSVNTKKYYLDEKFLTLVFVPVRKNSIYFIVETLIPKFERIINEDIFFLNFENDRFLFIKKPNLIDENSFNEIQLYKTSFGLILLSYLKKEDLNNLLEKTKFNYKGFDNEIYKKDFIYLLKKIKKDGYSINFDGIKTGFFDISIPVIDKINKKIYCLGVIIPEYKFNENYKNFILKELNKCKKNIENDVIKFNSIFR
ncbi:MAG TPA: IclR family transcriptional regulator C-terminal domain-containing protein [Caldisericia bacterium]|nr:IclR family transcriptional regulator C-terminal domain-containing protein [Caldisericia bacterium]